MKDEAYFSKYSPQSIYTLCRSKAYFLCIHIQFIFYLLVYNQLNLFQVPRRNRFSCYIIIKKTSIFRGFFILIFFQEKQNILLDSISHCDCINITTAHAITKHDILGWIQSSLVLFFFPFLHNKYTERCNY
jgi:hypothetical protein